MKRWISVVLAAVMMTGVFSCVHAEEESAGLGMLEGQRSVYEWDETELLCSIEWEKLIPDERSAEAYPELKKALDEINRAQETAMEQEKELLLPMAKELNDGNDMSVYCTSQSDYYIQRADCQMLSVLQYVYSFSGGAHPNYGLLGLNLAPETGRELTLSDVLTDREAAIELIAGKLSAKYPEVFPENPKEQLADVWEEGIEWTMNPQGLTVYVNHNVLAPYAAGLMDVTVRFGEAPELFNEEFIPAETGAYAIEIPMGMAVEFDLSGSGAADEVAVYPVKDEYDAIVSLDVAVNGKALSDSSHYAYEMKAWLVSAEEAGQRKSFLYAEGLSDNDYLTLYVYDLNGETPVRTGEMDGTGFEKFWSAEEQTLFRKSFVDAESFGLDTRLFVLGTFDGMKTYRVNPVDGVPYSEDEAYENRNEAMVLTTKKEMDAILTESGEKLTIPSGAQLLLIRTDEESYVDFRMEDGRECRMELDASEYPLKINGIPEEECFVDLPYAG